MSSNRFPTVHDAVTSKPTLTIDRVTSNRLPNLLFFLLIFAGSPYAQDATAFRQPLVLLDNDQVHITRLVLPAKSRVPLDSGADTFAVRLGDETVTFVAKGARSVRENPSDSEVVDLLIRPKRHWDTEVRPCAEPMKCSRETRMGKETIAWTTTLFTNGFLTASTHRVVRGGTLDSSYYSAKGSDRIVMIPFTAVDANFGGIDESLKPGQPYFSAATEVEVTATDTEARWFVLRMNSPAPAK